MQVSAGCVSFLKEGQMKNTIKFVAAAAVLFSATAAVRADEVDQVLKWLGKRGAPELCKKADFGSKIFSLRSFDGKLCDTAYIAALAESICGEKDVEGYNSSKCHTKAAAVLKGRDPAEVLKEAVKSGVGKAKEFACGREGLPGALKGACP
jgi:hypothetical protein